MLLEIHGVTEDDFPKFVPDLSAAMGGDNDFVNTLYPENWTPEGQRKAVERFIAHQNMDPTIHWIKVVDTDLDEIIGVSQWAIHDNEKPAEGDIDGPSGTWQNEEEKEYCQALYRSFMEFRWEVFRKEEWLPLMSIYVDKAVKVATADEA
jgi:hypothetical protein